MKEEITRVYAKKNTRSQILTCFPIIFIIFTSNMVEAWDILIQQLSDGNKQAYASVFREFYGPLVMYARRFINDRNDAEDIVQGFFCHLWENRDTLARIKAFKTYFYNSVHNRCLNYLRDHHTISIEGVEIREEEHFLLGMMEEEIYRELYATIRKLPDKCREVMILKLSGKGNREIAEGLHISEETVRSQLRRGRELLQKNLSGLLSLSWIVSLLHEL